VGVHKAGRRRRRGSLTVVMSAEDTGPFDACKGACFWHCTLPDGTRKVTPSQPSRGPHGAVDQDGAGVPCCKPARMLIRFSGAPRVGSTRPARRCWPFVFQPSARLDISPFSPHLPFTLLVNYPPHALEHGVLDLMRC
jgi:hypothetical protein